MIIAAPPFGLAMAEWLKQEEYDSRLHPVAALATLRNSDRIFTSDTLGGCLIYQRYPTKVSDSYGPEFETKYADVLGARYNWEATLATYDVDIVLLAVDSPLSTALKGSDNWRTVTMACGDSLPRGETPADPFDRR
jgi:hypothetical protein